MYDYNDYVVDRANQTIGSLSVPEGIDESLFRKGIVCEFNPITSDLLYAWVLDKQTETMYILYDGDWITYDGMSAERIAGWCFRNLSKFPDLPEVSGFGLITDQLVQMKRMNRIGV